VGENVQFAPDVGPKNRGGLAGGLSKWPQKQ